MKKIKTILLSNRKEVIQTISLSDTVFENLAVFDFEPGSIDRIKELPDRPDLIFLDEHENVGFYASQFREIDATIPMMFLYYQEIKSFDQMEKMKNISFLRLFPLPNPGSGLPPELVKNWADV